MKLSVVILSALLLTGTDSLAQAPKKSMKQCSNILEGYLKISGGKDSIDLEQFLTFGGGADCMTQLLLENYTSKDEVSRVLLDRSQALKAALQQNGASAGSGGSTSLVSKGMTAQLLAVAAEYGGLTEAASGQTVTLSGSLGGLPVALVKQKLLSNCGGIQLPLTYCVSNNTVNNLNRLSYSVSFNTGASSQAVTGTTTATGTGTAQPVTFSASGSTISSATGKFVILRGAAASISDIAKKIDTAGTVIVSPASSAQPGATSAMQNTSEKVSVQALWDRDESLAAPLKAWRQQAVKSILAAAQSGADDAEAKAVIAWVNQAKPLMDVICPATDPNAEVCRSNLLPQLEQYGTFVNTYKTGVNAFVEGLRKAPLLTFEYDYNQPASQPTNSTFRLVGQSLVGGLTFTFNTAASIYNSTPSSAIPGSSLLRDIQAAGEISYDFSKLKKASILGHSTVSGAFYFQDQTSPAILNVTPGQPVTGVTITGLPSSATQVFAQKGNIGIAQGKFTLTPNSSSISLPVSVTWSNRTELVTNAVWQGQVGISYNFDSLFGSSK